MIAMGGVGFTITALVEDPGAHRYHPFLRPAVLMGLLCYSSAIIMLMVELHWLWMVWMILISWAPTSALYEVGWCAFLYLNVLVLEFVQVPVEQLGWGRALRILRVIYIPIMPLGVTLSPDLHESSLGTLMTLLPHKVNVLWWSDLLPLLFLLSAIMAGPAMAYLEHLAAGALARLRAAPGFCSPASPASRPGSLGFFSRSNWVISSIAAPSAPC